MHTSEFREEIGPAPGRELARATNPGLGMSIPVPNLFSYTR